MDVIYLLVPLSIALVGIIVAAIVWAVRTRQFDDLEGPAHRILMEDTEVGAVDPESVGQGGDERPSQPG